MIYSTTSVFYLIKFSYYAELFDKIDNLRIERESIGKNISFYQYNLNDKLECLSSNINRIINTSGIRDADWLEQNPKSNLNRVFDNPVGALRYSGVCFCDEK